jgi:hypothetical protein
VFFLTRDPSIATARRLSRTVIRRAGRHARANPGVTRGLDPRVHLLPKNFCEEDGLHRNSGLPELRNMMRRTSGKPDVRVKPGNDRGRAAVEPNAIS